MFRARRNTNNFIPSHLSLLLFIFDLGGVCRKRRCLPFIDPSTPRNSSTALQGEAALFVSEDASLTLREPTRQLSWVHYVPCPRLKCFRSHLIDDRFVHRGCQLLWTTADQYVSTRHRLQAQPQDRRRLTILTTTSSTLTTVSS